MKFNAEIVCRRNEGYGMVCDWQGPRNGIAKLYAEDIDRDKIYEVGRLKLRVVQFPIFEMGVGCDAAAVMLESPHAQLYQFYRHKAESFVRLVMRFEVTVYAFRFKLKQGQEMPLTKRVADFLL